MSAGKIVKDPVVSNGVSFICPFCKRDVFAGDVGGEPGLLHDLPTCAQFDVLEPDEFLYEARIAMLGKEALS